MCLLLPLKTLFTMNGEDKGSEPVLKLTKRVENTLYSSLAQSVERMTVNHDVAGSSPAGGAKKFRTRESAEFLLFTFSLFTFH